MRIALGGVSHETSTFINRPTALADFEQGLGLFRGQEGVEHFRGTNMCTGGFLDGAAKHGFEPVPLLWTFAYPSGLIERRTYETWPITPTTRAAEHRATRPKCCGPFWNWG